MKRKMLTKLISAVCAVALTTSCTAMSVGAVPKGEATEQMATEQEINWEKELEDIRELLDVAKTVKNANCPVEDCQSLADRIYNFMGRDEYKALLELVHSVDDKILDEEEVSRLSLALMPELAVTELRSDKVQERRYGSSRAIDYFNCIIKIIENGLV